MSAASETDRIVIQGPVGSVILNGAVTECTNGHAMTIGRAANTTVATVTGRPAARSPSRGRGVG